MRKAPIKLVVKVYFILCCAAGILLDPLKLERKVFGGIQNSFVEPFQEGVEGIVTIARKESKHDRILENSSIEKHVDTYFTSNGSTCSRDKTAEQEEFSSGQPQDTLFTAKILICTYLQLKSHQSPPAQACDYRLF
jgi:hypothetical protein